MPEKKPYIIRRDGTFEERATGQVLGRVWLGDNGWYAENPRNRFGPNWTKWTVARDAWQDWQKIVSTPSPGQLRVQRARADRLKPHVLDNLEFRAVTDLTESEHESVSTRLPARMLLSLIAEVREWRAKETDE